jgi:hypothetical protein
MAFYEHTTVSRHFLTGFPPPSDIAHKSKRRAMHGGNKRNL